MGVLGALAIPSYVKNENQENYNDELNQTLRRFLSPTGWTAPLLTNAQVALIAPIVQVGAFWFNTDIAKMQLKTIQPNTVETIQSV